jgi:hypothetical protein
MVNGSLTGVVKASARRRTPRSKASADFIDTQSLPRKETFG